MKCLFLIIAISAGLLVSSVAGQRPTPAAQSAVATSGETAGVAKAEAERLRNERRLQARSLLIALASEARSFKDQALRARTMTRIADTLWTVDPEQARGLFRRAWDAAENADREGTESANFRQQVLSVIARRDRTLAEDLLQKMKDDQGEIKTDNSKRSLWSLNEAAQHRLDVAESFLRTGDVKQALQFADPVLTSVTISTLDFLVQLRVKDAAAADRRFAALLASSSGNMLSDANTVSLLSSYLFSPETYVVFNRVGTADSYWPRTPLPPADVSPELRLLFFQIAASILSRPQPSADQDQSTTGIAGKYMVLKRLMPLFDSFAPKEIAAAMHSHFETVSSQVTEELRNAQDESLRKGISPEKSLADEEQPLLNQIEHAKTSAERDDLYFRLALLALGKDDPKARGYVAKIDESEFRKRAQRYIDWGLAIGAIKSKTVETALELARNGDLTHVQRVWVMTQAAKVLAKTDRQRAQSLLEDATAEARRIDGSDLDRPRALLAIANGLQLTDPARVWDAIFDAVKAANSTEGFTGDGGAINVTVNSKSLILSKTDPVPDFDISGIFSQFANTDYYRAVQLAAGFQGEAARANATIAIARAILNRA